MTAGKPSPGLLWEQAGGGTPSYDREEYLRLMHEHGHILRPGDEGYERSSRTLSCGWEPGKRREEQDRCEVTDLLRASCSHCTGRVGEEPAPDRDISALGRAFPARYPGRCGWCDRPFAEHDRIRADTTAPGEYVCSRCWESP
jgi:hypothetical protein